MNETNGWSVNDRKKMEMERKERMKEEGERERERGREREERKRKRERKREEEDEKPVKGWGASQGTGRCDWLWWGCIQYSVVIYQRIGT